MAARAGFIPLASSMLSSDGEGGEVEAWRNGRQPFAPISTNSWPAALRPPTTPAAALHSQDVGRSSLREGRNISFKVISSPASKKARALNGSENEYTDYLENMLLQPVHSQGTLQEASEASHGITSKPLPSDCSQGTAAGGESGRPLFISSERLEELLSQPNMPNIDFGAYRKEKEDPSSSIHSSAIRSSPAPSSVGSTSTAGSSHNIIRDIEMLLFSEAPESSSTRGHDPFFGACITPIRKPAFSSIPPVSIRGLGSFGKRPHNSRSQSDAPGTPFSADAGARLIHLQDLSRNHQTPQAMRIKVLPKQITFNTPTFAKKIAQRAVLSNSRARNEQDEYIQFIQNLQADHPGPTNLTEDDDDEDDDFDLFEASSNPPNSDEAIGDQLEALQSIPNRELLSLFEENAAMRSAEALPRSVPVFVDDPPAKLDEAFRARFQDQLSLHFQMLIQSLALSGEIVAADQAWVTTLKMMIKINDRCVELGVPLGLTIDASSGLVLLMRILKQSPLHGALLLKIQKTVNDPDLRIRSSINSIPFKLKGQDTNAEGKFSKSFWHILSIFGDPFNHKYSLLQKYCPDALVDNQSGYEPKTLQGRRFDSFLSIEDRLLLLGLCRYGLGNWEKIQAQFLPTRTARQLYFRYKNMTSRRVQPNPIKEFAAEATRAFSDVEAELLKQGIRTYGGDWGSISSHFLPNRPAPVLKHMWMTRKEACSTILGVQFNSEPDDSDYACSDED